MTTFTPLSSTRLSPKSSLPRSIAYWVMTLLVVLPLAAGGATDVARIPAVLEIMTRLQYPSYFAVILGVWKVLGAVALLLPGTPRLKEWAYAGTFFDLTGAVASHLAVGDPATEIIAPIAITVFAVASWALRPASRRLAGPAL